MEWEIPLHEMKMRIVDSHNVLHIDIFVGRVECAVKKKWNVQKKILNKDVAKVNNMVKWWCKVVVQ